VPIETERVRLLGLVASGLLALTTTTSCTSSTATVAAPVPVDTAGAGSARQLAGRAFGTTWTVRWVEPSADGPTPDAVRAAIEGELRLVDEQMSTWRDDSVLAVARRAPGAVDVPAPLAEVVAGALALAEATDGAFDPTVQPLMELWGLHGSARANWPSDAQIAAARAQVDWRRVGLAAKADGGHRLDVGGTALDLSAIAKGYAVDRVAGAMAALGLASRFVEVGGEVRSAGPNPSGAAWTVGVSLPDPLAAPSELALVVRAPDAAIATSGNYRNRVVIDGRVVHHTMDPRRGAPVETDIASVTVIAPDCATADGWATALMVLPISEGRRLIEDRPGLDAAWLIVDGDGFRLEVSSGVGAHGPRWVEVVDDRVRRAVPSAP
jgi:FAD:protein FMN transferase